MAETEIKKTWQLTGHCDGRANHMAAFGVIAVNGIPGDNELNAEAIGLSRQFN